MAHRSEWTEGETPVDGVIDRASPAPVHVQLRESLRAAIGRGDWLPGTALPSETDIAQRHGVSRATVREALGALERAGLIVKRRGSGSYVLEAAAPAWLVGSSGGFFNDPAGRLGMPVRSVVLRAAVERLPDWAAKALGLPEGSEGVALHRLRWVDDKLVLYGHNYVLREFAPAVLAPGLEHDSLFRRLHASYGITITGGRRLIDAVPADDRVAEMLDLEPGAPVVRVESVSWDATRRPVDCYCSWIRSDHLQIEVLVGDDAPALGRYVRSRGRDEPAPS
jgi:GntR family transcriptional regulator